jgi:predicted phosphohydrolase
MIRKYAVCSDGRRIVLPLHVQDNNSAEHILKTLGVNSFDFTLEETEEALQVKLTEGQKVLLVGNARYEDKTVEDLIKSYNSLLNTCHEYQFYMKDYLCVTGRMMAFQQIRDEIKEYTKKDYKDKFSFLKKKAKENKYEPSNPRGDRVATKS